MVERPPLVERALRAARDAGLTPGCRDADGALRHVLAGRRGMGRVAEIGSGVGVGSAWVVSALAPGTPFVTVEADPDCAALVRALFTDDPDATVHAGDWRQWLPPEAPFDLLVVDARDARYDPSAVVELLQPRATVLLDDLTIDSATQNPLRDAWLGHPELAGVVVATDGPRASLVAGRR